MALEIFSFSEITRSVCNAAARTKTLSESTSFTMLATPLADRMPSMFCSQPCASLPRMIKLFCRCNSVACGHNRICTMRGMPPALRVSSCAVSSMHKAAKSARHRSFNSGRSVVSKSKSNVNPPKISELTFALSEGIEINLNMIEARNTLVFTSAIPNKLISVVTPEELTRNSAYCIDSSRRINSTKQSIPKGTIS